MAKTWTLKEAAKAIHENDREGIADLCRRFPVLSMAIAKVTYDESMKALLEAVPDYVTALKMERTLTGEAEDLPEEESEGKGTESLAGEEAESIPEEETPEERKKRQARERQRRKREKDRAVYDAQKEAEEAEAEEELVNGKYDEIGAVELWKMCKARGIAAEPKKSQRHYIDLLEADDMKVQKKEEIEEDEEDWGEPEGNAEGEEDDIPEEEPVKEEPKKSDKKNSNAKKSPAKKKDPEPAPEPDDEEDWDF